MEAHLPPPARVLIPPLCLRTHSHDRRTPPKEPLRLLSSPRTVTLGQRITGEDSANLAEKGALLGSPHLSQAPPPLAAGAGLEPPRLPHSGTGGHCTRPRNFGPRHTVAPTVQSPGSSPDVGRSDARPQDANRRTAGFVPIERARSLEG